ncbi:MAG: alcohol dehydrogenase catalytic domain-containing protein [Planctomycetota bacterium]
MAGKTARANLLDKPNGKFVIGRYPVPAPAPGTVLMKIEMCGICGTDIHTWRAPAEAVFGLEYPISLGHEISGVIEALGEGVTTDSVKTPVKVGDRIGVIPAIHCGRCYFCRIAKTPEKCRDWKTYGTWPRADREPPAYEKFRQIIKKHDPKFTDFELIERFAFYQRAAKAYAVVVTSEPDGNVILRKAPIMI